MKTNIQTNNERNFGIDALRILSMFAIVLMHILYKGNLLKDVSDNGNAVLWLIETVCFCAVNCYAMISGYVIYSDTKKNTDIQNT